ncbi:isocitrate lyase/PEP mutase family protein [Thalassobaculum sp.]|uniref:isocitrate lyase/PEP mutase family protein n=1 Tax=Thalassobaculum sp. TaxID=2022740 RepID=UPI0032EECCAA
MASLRDKLRPGKLLTAPGVFDGISVRLADRMGFDCLYMTGYGTVASHLGLPDAGLASYRDMVDRVRTFAGLANTPMVADGDTGYGGLLNVEHTVRGYEAAGAAALQLEDQEFPKKCGHTPGRRVIPIEQAAAKVKVAAESRASRDFLIVARTDARTAHGLDEALRRAEAFAKAGADILFVESPETVEEMETIGRSFDLPLLVNVVEGGKTPVLSAEEYISLGYQMAIYPAVGFLAMGAALESVYGTLRQTGASTGVTAPLTDFMDFSKAMGFQQVWDFEKKHAGLEGR